jgi:DNA-binding NarL/FixJ family response regulator
MTGSEAAARASGGLIGRRPELQRVLEQLERAGAAVVIEGEAGIGKSALWRAASDALSADGRLVLRGRTSQAEARLSFVTLGDLLDPVLAQVLAALDGPAHRALDIALMRADATDREPPDPRAIGLAVLGGLRALAAEQPVVLAIDDVQWLDAPSAAALGFALRRLEHEPVALLATRRLEPGAPDSDALEALLEHDRVVRVRVGPLSLGAVHEMIRTRLGVDLSRAPTVRLHEVSGGNAFFALELARELAARETAPGGPAGAREGAAALMEPLRVPDNVRSLVAGRLGRLPANTRETLLLAAALTRPTLSVLGRVQPDAESALEPALRAGIVELDGDRLRFEHPLLAAVPYGEALPNERRRLHARLAAILTDPEERARHEALAAEGPSAAVSRSLMAAARAARTRGAPQAAAELAELAVELTPTSAPQAQAERLLEAAELRFQTGAVERCEALLEDLLASEAPDHVRMAAFGVLGAVRGETRSAGAAIAVYEDALAQTGDGGADATRVDFHQRLAWNQLVCGTADAAEHHATAALVLAERLSDDAANAIALATAALVGVVRGQPVDEPAFVRARALETASRACGRWIWPDESPALLHGVALLWSGELEASRPLVESALELARDRGDAISLCTILNYLSPLATRAGDLRLGYELARESVELSLPPGPLVARTGALFVRAHAASLLGLVEETRASATVGLEQSERVENWYFAIGCLTALGSVAVSTEAFSDAAASLERAAALERRHGIEAPGIFAVGPELVEALLGSGRTAEAAAEASSWRARCEMLGRPWALALAHRCDGLVLTAHGEHDEAEAAFARALAEHERQARPLEHARTLLALGSALRQARRRRDARETLEAAREGFAALGAGRWAERARHELARIGGRAPAARTGELLTAVEQSIARLVSEGHTNREVGELLHLSPRTVEWNLSRIYRKLGVRSRTGLAAALSAEAPPEEPGEDA